MSPELKAFLEDWLAWATTYDAPQAAPYWREFGLCSNIAYSPEVPTNRMDDVRDELEELLDHLPYPFGLRKYLRRGEEGTQHEDPARLAWVRGQLDMKG